MHQATAEGWFMCIYLYGSKQKIVTRWPFELDSRAERRQDSNAQVWTERWKDEDKQLGSQTWWEVEVTAPFGTLHPTWWLHLYPCKSQTASADGAEGGSRWPQSLQLSAFHYLPGWDLQSVPTSLSLSVLSTRGLLFLCVHSFTRAYT